MTIKLGVNMKYVIKIYEHHVSEKLHITRQFYPILPTAAESYLG